MPETSIQCFMYLRKSTDDGSRQVRSIEDQEAELRDLARREELEVADVLVEKRTAKKPGRPVFNEMLERIEAGEANAILAWHPDRLSRNSLDGGRLIYLIDEGVIQDLRFPTFSFEPTASGKLMLGMMFGQSKYYVDNLSENIKRGIRQKVKSGIWPMVAPAGYLNDRRNRTIVVDPERGPLIRQVFERYATGAYTLTQIRRMGNDMGLTGARGGTFSKSHYHRLLQNPIYCGLIQYNGELYEGNHEPLVTKQQFDQVQAVLNQKSRPKSPSSSQYLYRGVFHCGECGCMVTNERQKGHVYLRCTKKKGPCSQSYVREDKMTRKVSDALESVALSPADADWMLRRLEKQQTRDREAAQTAATEARAEIEKISEREHRLKESYLDGVLTLDEFRQDKNRLAQERTSLKERLAGIEQNQANRLEPVRDFIKASREAVYAARSGRDEQKRDWLKNSARTAGFWMAN